MNTNTINKSFDFERSLRNQIEHIKNQINKQRIRLDSCESLARLYSGKMLKMSLESGIKPAKSSTEPTDTTTKIKTSKLGIQTTKITTNAPTKKSTKK